MKTSEFSVCSICGRDFPYSPSRPRRRQCSEKCRAVVCERSRARQLVSQKLRYAVGTGRIIRPKRCSRCGSDVGVIEGHHEDYNFLFAVEWLCRQCHSKCGGKP
jgi:ribosomal protein S27AE